MATLDHEGEVTGAAAVPVGARLAQACGGVGTLAVGGIGAALVVGFAVLAANGGGVPDAARGVELGAGLRGVAVGEGVSVAGLRSVTPMALIDCRAAPVHGGKVKITAPAYAVGAGGNFVAHRAQLWRAGRRLVESGELSGLSADIARGDVDPGFVMAGPGLSAINYSLATGEGGGAATVINLPALWLAVPLPEVYIGEALAAVAMARGEPVLCSYSQGTTVAGRRLVNGSGASRLFASPETFEAWRARVLGELAAQVGGMAVRAGSDRAAWVNAVREENAGKAMAVLRKAERVSGATERAALVADAAFIMGRV